MPAALSGVRARHWWRRYALLQGGLSYRLKLVNTIEWRKSRQRLNGDVERHVAVRTVLFENIDRLGEKFVTWHLGRLSRTGTSRNPC